MAKIIRELFPENIYLQSNIKMEERIEYGSADCPASTAVPIFTLMTI